MRNASNVNICDHESKKSSSEIPSSDESAEVPEDDEEVRFNLASISVELEHKPTCKV